MSFRTITSELFEAQGGASCDDCNEITSGWRGRRTGDIGSSGNAPARFDSGIVNGASADSPVSNESCGRVKFTSCGGIGGIGGIGGGCTFLIIGCCAGATGAGAGAGTGAVGCAITGGAGCACGKGGMARGFNELWA